MGAEGRIFWKFKNQLDLLERIYDACFPFKYFDLYLETEKTAKKLTAERNLVGNILYGFLSRNETFSAN
jgi:hypothetical protein